MAAEDGTGLREVVNPDVYRQGVTIEQDLSDTFAWSPDGTTIAFTGALTDRFGLFTVPAAGGRATWIAAGGRNPSWAPDSRRIAYAAMAQTGDWNIFVVAAARGTPIALTNGGDNRWPQWSPDGTQISFLRSGVLHVMNADGTGVTPVASAIGPARWSADSSRLLFTCGGSEIVDSGDVCVVGRTGSDFAVLTGNQDGDAPVWSPDGTRIAYVKTGGVGGAVRAVTVMNADGSNVVDLAVSARTDGQPAWSPDGSRIAFTDDYSPTGVSVMNATGTGWKRLADGWAPAWQPVPPTPPVVATTSLATGSIVTAAPTTTVLSTSTPFDNVAAAIPGLVEAENFDEGGPGVAYVDTSPGNKGGQYRPTDVDIETTLDAGGGYDVGWTRAGEWLQYTVNIAAAGVYTLSARVASSGSGGTFHVELDGSPVTGVLTVPDTFGWQQWTDVPASVTLPAGVHALRIVFDTVGASGGVGNFNAFRFTAAAASTPFHGVVATIPGLVEAENFDDGGPNVAYVDTSTDNKGGQYRDTDVDIETTLDPAGGGYDVGWTRAGEWLQYTVNIAAAGVYTLTARVASSGNGGTFHVELDRTDVTGVMTVGDTFGWQRWANVTASVTLPAGTHVLRVVFDTVGSSGGVGNFNYFSFVPASGPWDY